MFIPFYFLAAFYIFIYWDIQKTKNKISKIRETEFEQGFKRATEEFEIILKDLDKKIPYATKQLLEKYESNFEIVSQYNSIDYDTGKINILYNMIKLNPVAISIIIKPKSNFILIPPARTLE